MEQTKLRLTTTEECDNLDNINYISVAPLIHIPLENESTPASFRAISKMLVNALQTSGFLRITTPLVPIKLQTRALEVATTYLVTPSTDQNPVGERVIDHPSDPKRYVMLTSRQQCQSVSPILAEYIDALESAKIVILKCIAVALNLEPSYFIRLHSENNSSLRLLQYPKAPETTGNRCKEHSDYGTITLLLTDGVGGLEAFHDNKWLPVPHVPGSLVVNAGSLLEKWTNNRIPATLHRVAGPTSKGSTSAKELLRNSVKEARTSIAFFADPNEDVVTSLQSEVMDCVDNDVKQKQMSVSEYIRWRSSGENNDTERSGVAFTKEEEERVQFK